MSDKVKISMTVPEQLWIDYREFCKKNGMKCSTRVAVLIKDDMKRGLK